MVELSFIVPCYRVEQYVRKCLNSIYEIPMHESEFEVLCFDDCAPDHTPQILDEYAALHTNFRVVHSSKNVGPGGGRNRMLDIAFGRYVWFVDGDDSILAENVPNLLQLVNKEDLDVLAFSYLERDNNGNIFPTSYIMPDSKVQQGSVLANNIFPGGLVNNMGYPVRFILKHDYLITNHIRFPENMAYGEDTVWMARVILKARRLQSTSLCAYVYWHHEDSTCGTLNKAYPGRTIYERTILTSVQLIEFAAELKESSVALNDEILLQYSKELSSFAQSHYVNQLPILLSRTTNYERRNFYKLISTFDKLCKITYLATPLTRILMNRWIGPCASGILSILYKSTHKNR